MQVARFKMIGHWADVPEVETYKVILPSPVDPYFWLHWDTVNGRAGHDRCGYLVADLNRFLQQGKLVFKRQGQDQRVDPWCSAFE